MADVRVDYHDAAERELASSSQARTLMQDLGDHIAHTAAAGAPRRTGAGAASIHAETDLAPAGWQVRISWDQRHYYLTFSEVGTEHMHARPFLRPALERARI